MLLIEEVHSVMLCNEDIEMNLEDNEDRMIEAEIEMKTETIRDRETMKTETMVDMTLVLLM